ncbi:GntR family transcriptional regulator [Serinibacter arcticus]|uniref:GntR family transcriptional regulator n=1 Tax=Serinibacter arcticus TaxID=1655435 RepID=A0A2U1ZUV0_9MICO|nr:GntR family transcriptional regulator [Serinibacter arcticus]PWD50754.1 GntR family transcriptional regulator [Serinibacter arcticus]
MTRVTGGTAEVVDEPGAAAGGADRSVVADGPVPKHAQLRSILLSQVGHAWQPHAAIPSERELMVTYGVSRATVREAIRALVEEQKLYKVQGKGTFVAGHRVQTTLHLASFTEDMRRRGLVPSTLVRSVELVEAPVEARASLGLEEGEKAWRIERLRLAGGVPMAFELAWYSARVAPDLGSRDLAGSLYGLLADVYGVRIDHAEQTAWAEAVDAERAELLGVEPGAPVLVFRRTSGAANQVVEHVVSWYRGDRYQVHMSLAGR